MPLVSVDDWRLVAAGGFGAAVKAGLDWLTKRRQGHERVQVEVKGLDNAFILTGSKQVMEGWNVLVAQTAARLTRTESRLGHTEDRLSECEDRHTSCEERVVDLLARHEKVTDDFIGLRSWVVEQIERAADGGELPRWEPIVDPNLPPEGER
jgi:hypothetical protein